MAQQFDPLLMEIAQRSGSLDAMLGHVFSFLYRKTDFYVVGDDESFKNKTATMGFPEGEAEKLLLRSYRKYHNKRMKPNPAPAPAPAQTKPTPQPPPTSSPQPQQPSIKLNEKGEQIPIGNGGVTPNYYWTQSLYETTIYAKVPAITTGKGVSCSITSNSLTLKLKGSEEHLIKGDFPHAIKVDESLWSLDSETSTVIITLDKAKRTWWASVVVGDPSIDTSQVDSTMKIDEYDSETQAQIRKIMFDQKQQRAGFPTSDEMMGVGSELEKVSANVATMRSEATSSLSSPFELRTANNIN
ncbi:hypothetical protein TL16_g05825 [Triparma laevis f. inornata]|uniref:CS domain-containing protein n=2 Tax=Triparma laevis TaxID=1534972 RepID=A0A9W7KSX6_9STRA|nr:hypothetical protein TL16_g05825 [Triparma laevis f. inornata]GMI10205.1 hypothetical protein TrLO_g15592 [Triparma laevis f. longispina]